MSSSNPYILNETEALERFGGEIELYEELLAMFVSEPQFSLIEIQKDLAEHKLLEAVSKIHRLKGTAGTIGAEKLYAAAQEAESVLKGKKEGDISKLILEVSALYIELVDVIRGRPQTQS